MARSLQFAIDDQQISCSLEKLDRNKLYGWVEKKAFDRDGNECFFGAISSDGMHIFGKESFELGYLGSDGNWLERGSLTVVDADNEPLQKQEASFKTVIELRDTVPIDTYLMHTAKSVYHLEPAAELVKRVSECDEIYTFPFNYTASYKCDAAFLILNEGELFMVVGQHCGFEYLEMQTIEDTLLQDDEDEDDDDIDFSMF